MLKEDHVENEINAHASVGVGGSLLDELARDGARARYTLDCEEPV